MNRLWRFMMFSGLCAYAVVQLKAAADAPPLNSLARMPVREVTVFKDGHAFILHQGSLPTDASGNVLMDCLPAPVLGTFWPSVAQKDVKLFSVTAGQRRVSVERSPLNIRELIEANIDADVTITETPSGREQQPVSYPATILRMTERSFKELEAVAPPNSGDLLPQKGEVVLLKTAEGVKAVNIARIQDVTFKDPPKNVWGNVEFRNVLTLQLDWNGRKPGRSVDAGLTYVQRGIRWIPNYKVTIDGNGKAAVKLQATLLNELTDLNDVTCNLVIGVPTFQFKDTVDPMALQQNLAQLSQYFRESSSVAGQSAMLSNAIMSQAPRMSEYRSSSETSRPSDLGPEIGGANQVEDLHIFTVNHVTLKKGQRMVVPVAEFIVPYKDVFVLEIPFAPPDEVRHQFSSQQQTEIAKLLSAPKVMHKIRLENKSEHPFTTAPALIVRDSRVLGQGLMTYTAKGGSSDLPVTTAVDIQVKKAENETARIPNANNWNGSTYSRMDLTGTISLTNYRNQPVTLDVVRHVLGNITEAGQDGKIEMINLLEDSASAGDTSQYPSWWYWWNWPYWWNHFNGIGRVKWNVTLDAGKSVDLKYQWHYYWR
jgi:hypothetical protein